MRSGQLVTFYDGHSTGRTRASGTSSMGVPNEKHNVITVVMKQNDVGLVITEATRIDDSADTSTRSKKSWCFATIDWDGSSQTT